MIRRLPGSVLLGHGTGMLACVGLLLLSVGWTNGGSMKQSIVRPLHLPRVARGASCPISHGSVASRLDPRFPRMAIAGSGPIYLMSVGGEPAASVSIADSRRDDEGWLGQKAPWLAGPGGHGPLLIRGRRLDAPGELRFARATGQHLSTLYQQPAAGRQPSGWRFWPSLLLVRTPGCYGLQIDGTTLSEVIVVRVHE